VEKYLAIVEGNHLQAALLFKAKSAKEKLQDAYK